MEPPGWPDLGIDVERPTMARTYDYLLGGCHNFAADRDLAHKSLAVMPDLAVQAHTHRAFLHRAVRFLVEAGVRQFLDIGSGIPTRGNVHEVAQKVAPGARVVYVDIDPVAVLHSRQILAGNGDATVIQEDLRHPGAILDHPDLRALLDLDQPVALLLMAILPVIVDADRPLDILARLRAALAPGSYLAIAHNTPEARPEVFRQFSVLSHQASTPMELRGRAEIARFFTGFDLVEPGLVWAPLWRPDTPDSVDEHPEACSNLVGVGRKP